MVFFFQAEDGIRDRLVTGVQTCALPILAANQVALWTGDNSQSDQGFIAQWIEIDPGADGTFSVVSSQYTGSTGTVGSGTANGSKGYGLNGIRLKESFVLGQSTIENRPATEVGTTSARMSGEVIDPGSSTPLVTLDRKSVV